MQPCAAVRSGLEEVCQAKRRYHPLPVVGGQRLGLRFGNSFAPSGVVHVTKSPRHCQASSAHQNGCDSGSARDQRDDRRGSDCDRGRRSRTVAVQQMPAPPRAVKNGSARRNQQREGQDGNGSLPARPARAQRQPAAAQLPRRCLAWSRQSAGWPWCPAACVRGAWRFRWRASAHRPAHKARAQAYREQWRGSQQRCADRVWWKTDQAEHRRPAARGPCESMRGTCAHWPERICNPAPHPPDAIAVRASHAPFFSVVQWAARAKARLSSILLPHNATICACLTAPATNMLALPPAFSIKASVSRSSCSLRALHTTVAPYPPETTATLPLSGLVREMSFIEASHAHVDDRAATNLPIGRPIQIGRQLIHSDNVGNPRQIRGPVLTCNLVPDLLAQRHRRVSIDAQQTNTP